MYVIIVYDIAQKRVNKVCKLLRRYLNWVQNSVFEGEITEGKMFALEKSLNKLTKRGDSILIYKFRDKRWIKKQVIGKEKNIITNII